MKWLLDSGDPEEYKELQTLARSKGDELWGSTTNPSLIAKKLSGRKVEQKELFGLQKQIVLEILGIVPGAVSAEVYADSSTSFEDMVRQGEEIATWHKRVVVKLPTTAEGFRARTELRKQGVVINNTLVFSKAQIFAICLHEKLVQQAYNPKTGEFPPFISPFVGRLDDQNEDGMMLVEEGMRIKEKFDFELWMLEASVRRVEHVKRGFAAHTELMTVPAKILKEWLDLSAAEKGQLDAYAYSKSLNELQPWQPSEKLLAINSLGQFQASIENGELDIKHPLTDTGIERFSKDWNALIK